MNKTKAIRGILVVLWAAFFVLYMAAKIHFFTQYDPLNIGGYLQDRSVYWAAMAVVALLAWLISKILQDQHPK